MPYKLEGNCVKKVDGGAVPGGCHKTREEAVKHLRALEVNVKNSPIAQFSMIFTKAKYNADEVNPNRRMQWRSVNSDTDSDLYDEQMSKELFYDFTHRINDNIPVPEQFEEVICEGDWCGGMPYLSIAHYKAGTGMGNVPGIVDSVYVEGEKLKSRGFCNESPLGHAVYESLKNDILQQRSGNKDNNPVRISIGFLDLEHKHLPQVGGQEFIFTRSDVGQICPLCAQGIGGKIYMKGQLVHLALTRVPVNPRTEMVAEGMEEKSMDEITTKRDDAKSIVGELADVLEEKSFANDVLVVKSDEKGSLPQPDPSELTPCYDENTGGWNSDCISSKMEKYMPQIRKDVGTPVKSDVMEKSLVDALASYFYKSNGYDVPVVEDAMKENVEKTSLGGEAVPHVPFKHTQDGVTVTGEGNPIINNPVKAQAVDDEDKKDEAKETKKSTALDIAYETLKTLVDNKAGVDEINKAFSNIGTEVEKAYAPEPKAFDPNDIASIVKSAVEAAVTPLRMELATLKAGQANNTVSSGVIKSKALTIGGYPTPQELLQKALPQQPVQRPNPDGIPPKIAEMARRSVYQNG